MNRVLIGTLVAFSLTAAQVHSKTKEWARGSYGDKVVVLTDGACRYNGYFPEAYVTDKNNKVSYFCYWSDAKAFFFDNDKKELFEMTKSSFTLSKSML